MSKPMLTVSADLLKSQVQSFTRKDGAFVQAHDSGKQAAAPAEFGVHHSKLKEGDHLYDKSGQKVDEVEGFSRGVNSQRVHTRAGYTHGTRSDGFLPGLSNVKPGSEAEEKPKKASPRMVLPKAKAAPKTGSAAPAKTVNAGSEKWPMHVKSSEKLSAKHEDGSTHHVGGFKPPEYPDNGGATDGDVSVHHNGKHFSFTGKKGKNNKTGEDSYEYSHKDEDAGVEHRAWVSRSGHLQDD